MVPTPRSVGSQSQVSRMWLWGGGSEAQAEGSHLEQRHCQGASVPGAGAESLGSLAGARALTLSCLRTERERGPCHTWTCRPGPGPRLRLPLGKEGKGPSCLEGRQGARASSASPRPASLPGASPVRLLPAPPEQRGPLAAGRGAGQGSAGFPGRPGPFCPPRRVGPLVSHTLSPPPRSLGAVMCGVVTATQWGQGT